MVSFFSFAANETTAGSLYYLGSIFGPVGNVLQGNNGGAIGILGSMFTVFNTSVLAIGTVIITYTTGMSILLTAHEGEMLGKKFHGLWLPLRTIMGIATLVPGATGYSYLQVALMWFIIQGVGAADALWTQTVNFMNGGTTIQPQAVGAPSTTMTMSLGILFSGLVCQAAEKATGITTSGYVCTDNPQNPWCSVPDPTMLNISGGPQVSNGTYSMGMSGECGSVNLGSGNQTTALATLIPNMGAIATQLVSMDSAYNTYVNTPPAVGAANTQPTVPTVAQNYCTAKGIVCTPQTMNATFPPPSKTAQNPNTVNNLYWTYGLQPTLGNFLATQAALYVGMGAGQANNGGTNAPTGNPEIDNGWIFAGAYFYTFTKANQAAGNGPPPPPSVTSPSASSLSATTNVLYNEAMTLIQTIGTSGSSGGGTSGGGGGGGGGPTLNVSGGNAFSSAMIGSWIDTLSSGNNPIVAAQTFGTALLTTVEIAWPILTVALFATAAIFNATGLGSVAAGTGSFIAFIAATILMFFVVIFLGIGATFAVYVPMVPIMLFSFGAINWIVATIETMIGAPIIAIGLLYPEGKHELWGNAEAAINLLLNIFLRPSLMIFGMIAAMLLSSVAINFVNASFLAVVNMIVPYLDILEAVFFMVLYTSLFTTVLNKCFELIHVVPDKILRWIGGGQEQFGEGGAGAALGKVEQGFQAGEQKAAGAVQGSAKMAGDYGAQAGKERKQGKQHKETIAAMKSAGEGG